MPCSLQGATSLSLLMQMSSYLVMFADCFVVQQKAKASHLYTSLFCFVMWFQRNHKLSQEVVQHFVTTEHAHLLYTALDHAEKKQCESQISC